MILAPNMPFVVPSMAKTGCFGIKVGPKCLENDVFLWYIKENIRAKIPKNVNGHNFWLECPTDQRSTFLSCTFDALWAYT